CLACFGSYAPSGAETGSGPEGAALDSPQGSEPTQRSPPGGPRCFAGESDDQAHGAGVAIPRGSAGNFESQTDQCRPSHAEAMVHKCYAFQGGAHEGDS